MLSVVTQYSDTIGFKRCCPCCSTGTLSIKYHQQCSGFLFFSPSLHGNVPISAYRCLLYSSGDVFLTTSHVKCNGGLPNNSRMRYLDDLIWKFSVSQAFTLSSGPIPTKLRHIRAGTTQYTLAQLVVHLRTRTRLCSLSREQESLSPHWQHASGIKGM